MRLMEMVFFLMMNCRKFPTQNVKKAKKWA